MSIAYLMMYLVNEEWPGFKRRSVVGKAHSRSLPNLFFSGVDLSPCDRSYLLRPLLAPSEVIGLGNPYSWLSM